MRAGSMPDPISPLAVTMGDPAGIGPEIVARLAADPRLPDTPFVVVGDVAVLRRAIAIVGADLKVIEIDADLSGLERVRDRSLLPVLQTGPALPDDLPFGQVNARAGAAS